MRPSLFGLLGAALLMSLLATGCGGAPIIHSVTISPTVISPNGDGVDDYAVLRYTVARPATLTVVFRNQENQEYVFRDAEPRPPGQYQATFYGTHEPDKNPLERRVMPSGLYTFTVVAVHGRQKAEVAGTLQIKEADTDPPMVGDVSVLPQEFTPDGDFVDDETLVSYSVSKPALVTVFVTDMSGNDYILEPEEEKSPALHPIRWNGKAAERRLPDGEYTLHILARDTSGNQTDYATSVTIRDAGIPRLEILRASFDPKAAPIGGVINVEIVVKNTGETSLRSLGPLSGTPYDTFENFLRFRGEDGQPIYFERPGFWRVGVMWEQAASPYPVRWGWGDEPLAPGQEAVIKGTIKLVNFQSRYVRFWVNIIQEGVGYPQEPVGHTQIAISY